MGDGGDNVVVAVRVRPFNDREKGRNAQLVIDMPDGKRTCIRDPNNSKEDPKWFSFDHSYWSHDGYRETSTGYLEPANSKYADQKRVFDDLGQGVLDNAWKGYNCSLFAYGQTGSGKSYSMVGPKNNQGIIPIVCEELFKRIEEAKKSKTDTEYQVQISMFEIYCEKVRDLLSSKPPPKGGLRIREHPKTGFYVQDLTSHPVNSYKEIARKIDEGTKSRSIAATNMNATSSRAHTIVKIQFAQKTGKSGGGTTTKTSIVNLVDLAGSERQRDAGSEGDRLKEGIVINQSLSTLGRVIKALHEQQTAKGKKAKIIQVPYRDSVLTSLLKNALGGNSKTIMIAALSPADINYEETLSTLRFADRTKSIKTKAVVNESATERMIRELREENARLQDLIKGGGNSGSSEELEALRKQLEENQKEMANLELTWQQKLEEAKRRDSTGGERAESDSKRKTHCQLWNLNEDSALTDVIVHFIDVGQVTVGNKNATPPAQIILNGLSIQPQHAVFTNKDNKKVTLTPLSGAEILVNGKRISSETELQQNDRILFGGNHLYVFANPFKSGLSKAITYDQAQAEIAQNSGLAGLNTGGSRSKADLILEEELVSLLPQVYRANAMAKELGRKVTFEIVLVAPEARGLSEGLTQIWIKVRNEAEDTNFLWEKTRFLSRYSGMQEMYQAKAEGDSDWNLPKERDPFYEPPESEVFVGSAVVFLQSLSYLVELEEQFPIFDFQGEEMGSLSVAISPTSPSGKEIKGQFVEDPSQLVGKDLGFKVRILCAYGLPQRIYKSCCKYRFFGEKEKSTAMVAGSSPAYAHEANYVYRPVTKEVSERLPFDCEMQLLNYLKNANLYITVYGTQKGRQNRSHHLPTPPPRNEGLREKANRVQRVERLVDEAKKADNKSLSVKALSTVLDGEGAHAVPTADGEKSRSSKGSSRRKKSSSRSSRDKSRNGKDGENGEKKKTRRKKSVASAEQAE